MSIGTDVARIKGNITAALAAIADKGVTVPAGSTSDALAGLIASIESGGGAKASRGTFVPSSDINLSTAVAVEHNSGFIPDIYFLFSTSSNALLFVGGKYKCIFTGDERDAYGAGYSLQKDSSALQSINIANYPASETVFYVRSGYGHKMYAGVEYLWYAIGGLS